MELGNVLILDSIAEESGLKDDLMKSFGEKWRWILALAMAQAIKPSKIDDSMEILSKTCITDILDLKYPDDGRIPVEQRISNSEQMKFYSFRHARHDAFHMLCVHIPVKSGTIIRPNKLDKLNLGNDKGFNILMSFSNDGDPIGIQVTSGTPRDISVTLNFLRELVQRYGKFYLVLGQDFVDTGSISDFLDIGVEVVALTHKISESIFPAINNMLSKENVIESYAPDGRRYVFSQEYVGVIESNHYTSYVNKKDDRFGKCKNYINVFPTIDVDVNKRNYKALIHTLTDIVDTLDDTYQENPLMTFLETSKEFSRYLKMKVSADGIMKVSLNSDTIENERNLFGLTILINSSGDWNQTVNMLSSAFSIISDFDLSSKKPTYIHGSITRDEREFSKLIGMISIMMLSNLRKKLKYYGYDLDPRRVLHLASTYMLIDVGDQKFTTDPDRIASKLMD